MRRSWWGAVVLTACDSGALSVDPSDFEGDDAGECVDRADNDRDGAFDCDDPGCAASPDCLPPDTDGTDDTDDTEPPDDTEPADDTDLPLVDGAVRETFPAAAEGPVDLVLVIDDSSDMANGQTRFLNAFPRLVEALDARFDVRAGVITTDVDAQKAGQLRTVDDARWFAFDPFDPPTTGTLRDFLLVGTSGSGDERGLRAFRQAFVAPSASVLAWNAGFLRDDAVTHVVVLSSEDDQSGQNPTLAQFDNELEDLKESPPSRFSAITGPETGTCDGGSSAGGADAAPRYLEVVRRSQGVAASYCATMDAALTAVAREIAPNLSSVALVRARGTVVTVRIVRDGTVWRGQPDIDGPTCAPEPCFRWRQEDRVVRFLDGFTAPSGSTIVVDVLPEP